MDLFDLTRIAFRRWYFVLPAIALVVAGALSVRSSVEVTYRSTGSILLFAPRVSDSSLNRLLGFNSLIVPAGVVAQVVSLGDTRERLVAQGASEKYEVGLDPVNPAPLVFVTAEGGLEQAPLTITLVLAEVSAELQRRQEALGAPPETWITAEVVAPPQAPVVQTGSQTRSFIGVLVLGLGVTAGLTVGLDALLHRRKLRRSAKKRRLAVGSAGAPPGPPHHTAPPPMHDELPETTVSVESRGATARDQNEDSAPASGSDGGGRRRRGSRRSKEANLTSPPM